MSERYGKGMRHCCDSPAQPSQKHIKGCVNEEKSNLADTIEALSSKNEEQALVIRELAEALQSIGLKLVSEAAIASRSGQMESLEALSDMAFAAARAAIAKAKQP